MPHSAYFCKKAKKKIEDIAKCLAGHSLGEYSAICASGSLGIAETAKLLKTRGNAMQNAVPKGVGSMVALLNVNYAQVAKMIKDFGACEISNDNSTQQVVISGETEKIEEFCKCAKDNGVKKVIKLNVIAPFHCKLMKPAADIMQSALSDIKFDALKVPIIANVTAQMTKDTNKIKNLLAEQITQCVRWTETVNFCINNGINKFIEIGTNQVLTKLIKRTYKDAKTCNLSSVADLDNAIEFIHEN